MAETYRVTGMTCQGCAKSVTRAIEGAATGVSVSVDLDAKAVTVTGDVSADAIATAVTDAGFEFEGVAS